MDINRIRQFCTVVETGHLRNAAELLNMSPGALSKAMKLLQQEMRSKLLTQDGRGIRITDEGRRMYASAQRVLAEFASMLASASSVAGQQSKTIRIASFELFTSYFMGKLAKDYFPTELFHVAEKGPGQIEEAILNQTSDLGLTYAPVPHNELEFLKIGQFENGIFVRRGAFRNVAISLIPFAAPITAVSGSPTGITSLDGWPSDIPRFVKYRFELLETGLETTRLGLSAIFCPDFVVPLQNVFALADPKEDKPMKASSFPGDAPCRNKL